MNYRTAVILPLKTLTTTGGTEVIDINVKDPITALRFEVKWTSYASGARLAPEIDIFSKIEIVDGSDVLLSLDGTEIAAVYFYEGVPIIHCDCSNLLADTAYFHLQHNFGRFFRDPLLAFDPTKYRNPQLRITYNPATPHASATALELEVTAELFDEKVISPIGFLRTTQFHSYSPGDSEYEYIDLPTDQVIRKLYLQTQRLGYGPTTLLTDVKLSEDNDKRIPFEMTDTNWCDLCAMKWGFLTQAFWATINGVTVPCFPAATSGVHLSAVNTTEHNAVRVIGMSGGKLSFDGATTTDIATGIIGGLLPYHVHCYPFGNDLEPEDWYDVTKVGSLRLRVQSSTDGDGATFNTILQQLRRY